MLIWQKELHEEDCQSYYWSTQVKEGEISEAQEEKNAQKTSVGNTGRSRLLDKIRTGEKEDIKIYFKMSVH